MSKLPMVAIVALLTAFGVVWQPVGAPALAQGDGDAIPVVATYSILGDFVAEVGGDRIALRTLVGPGGDAHTFEPSPDDGAALVEAAVIFENGLGFETWLDELYEASGSEATRVVVTDEIEPLTFGGADDEGSADGSPAAASPAGEAAEEEPDPHVWQDVANAELMVAAVRDGLAAADPEGAEAYEANAAAYLAELAALDEEIVGLVEALPEAERKLVTSHDALAYFADRYGFEVVGTAIASVSTEAADPSAGEIAALVEAIRATGVPAIFAENIHSPELIARIAEEADVALAPTLYTDALGEPGSEGGTYVEMMRFNAETIVGALAS